MTVRKKCSRCLKGRNESRYVGTKGTVCDTCRRDTRRATARRSHLTKTYGITPEEYDALLEAQGGVCAACGQSRPYNLPVDHDHQLERELVAAGVRRPLATRRSIRGLICKRENGVLRDLRDSPQILLSLADYVRNPQAQRILNALAVLPETELVGSAPPDPAVEASPRG